jgi:hypothetical protein
VSFRVRMMRATRFGVGLLAVLWVLRSNAAEIWDRAILKQPFDKDPFHQIRIPGWVEDTVGVGYTLSGMTTEQRQKAAAAGVTISELIFVDPLYPYYDSRLLKKRSPHVPLDRLRKDVAEYQRIGLRILAVYPPSLQGEVYENHPDWRRVASNTTEIPSLDLRKYPHGGMLCLLGPYGDFLIEVLAEILTLFPEVDAFSFDGLHYGGVCYCQHCREAFRLETGQPIPNVDLSDPAFRKYQHWADRRMEDLVRRMQRRLKQIKAEVALITWTTNAGRFGHFRDIPRNMPARLNLLFDAPDQELWLDESNRGTTVVPAFAAAYAWAVSNHRVAFSEPYLMSHGNPYGKDSFPAHEIERRMMLVLTQGAAPSIAVGQPAHLQPALYRCLQEVRLRQPWLTHKQPLSWAALVMSDNTRNFYGRQPDQVETRYLAHVLGVFRAALEEHLPLTVINDWNLTDTDLASYKVVVLANTACLDAEQVGAVRRFVQNAGGLVATLDTSLLDEMGDARTNFALADVLGVQHRGAPRTSPTETADLDSNFAKGIDPNYWDKRKGIFDFTRLANWPLESPRLKAYLGADPVTFKGPAVRVALTGSAAQVAGHIRPKQPGADETLPAVVLNSWGRGRVVYLAAGLDAANYLYAYPYERLILSQAMEWAASAPPPVRVEAPMCVQATVMHQAKGGHRLVVHLFNDLNTTSGHAFPNDDVPLREEVIPIRDIKVIFSGADRISRVHQEPGGRVLALQGTAAGQEVRVPSLEIHTLVVAELTP